MVKLAKIGKAIARQIPGTWQYRARQKYAFERELQDQGRTRSEAKRIAAERFKKHG